MPRSVCD